MGKLAVIAFGGNAILKSNQKGTIEEQLANVYEACNNVSDLIEKGYNIVIGHGNGPQVGNVMLQHDAGEKVYDIPKQPMDVCVAETQGSIGYMIENQLRNVLQERGIKRNIITIVTQVLVDENDEAFSNPNKPVGPYYNEEDIEFLKQYGWHFKEDPRGRGYRRVVASPKPVEICNWKIVKQLAEEGNIIITVGGGGIPVKLDSNGKYSGVEAVIDKDLASSTLAQNINAESFYILTDVSNVYINFNTPEQEKLEDVSIKQIQRHLDNGQFTEGSMAPKVRAGIQFVEGGGKETIITDAKLLSKDNVGTRIIY